MLETMKATVVFFANKLIIKKRIQSVNTVQNRSVHNMLYITFY